MKPDIRIAWRQGFALAYQVVGTGTDDIVYLPGYESNVDRIWDIPAYRGFLERLSSLGRLITHDRRGLGFPDRVPPGAAVTLEEGRDDLVAVMDAAGCRRATVFAAQEAVFTTLLLAATRPERVERLVLFGASPSYAWSDDLPDGWTEEQREAEIRTWEQVTSLAEFLDGHARAIAPSLEGNDAGLEALRHLLASTVGLGAAIAEPRSLSSIDMRAVLPSVTAPTLVIRLADDVAASASSGRFLAERLVEGTYIEIPGRDSLAWVGDPDPILQATGRFMAPELSG